MIKKAILTLGALALFGAAQAQSTQQSCGTDQFYKEQKAKYPSIAAYEEQLKKDIDNYLSARIPNRNAKGTAIADTPWADDVAEMHIPVVVHIVYDYAGAQSTPISDNEIFGMMTRLNEYYHGQNAGLPNGIIPPFRPYIGNAHITFHLAHKDPKGNPTKGITRHYSYTASGGDESAKIDPWPADQYLNVYLENFIGKGASKGTILAYATFPTSYASNPYSQGVISRADQVLANAPIGQQSTLAHEIGHFLMLEHPWSSNGQDVEGTTGKPLVCGDDEVDDTPPTIGHFSCGPSKLYDTMCATGYYKDYDSVEYYKRMGVTGNFPYQNLANDGTVMYKDSSSVGQTFGTGLADVPLNSIAVLVDSFSLSGDSTNMSLFNASGTTLLATSTNAQIVNAATKLIYNFSGVLLRANTTYKFVINKLAGTDTAFLLRSTVNANSFASGVLYTGKGAAFANPNRDLYFELGIGGRRIDYPDTTNTQNIMDYSSCNTQMFTKGQVARMRGVLRSNVGFRNRLVTDANLLLTGVKDANGNFTPSPDLAPVADFSVNKNFVCADPALGSPVTVTFTNRSYNDTIDNLTWTIGKAASGTGATSNTVTTSFGEIGWVPVTLTVNSNAGSNTLTRSDLIYAADPVPVNPSGYFQEFDPTQDLAKYPIFNYFNNPDHRWELVNYAGYYDNTSIRYANYDKRQGPTISNASQSPGGNYADFYTRAFDLSGFGGECNLDFFSAGAFRTNKPSEMNDVLEIFSSSDCGNIWTSVAKLTKADIGNNGLVSYNFVPGWMGHWKEQSIPVAARGGSTFFRFRFTSGTDIPTATGFSVGTGNNFYIDRIQVTASALGVKNGIIVNLGMNVAPNPTSGSATISINGGDNSTAEVNVTDVTGKVVYRTSVIRKSTHTKIEIPASALTVKGMYLVQVVTNGATETQKLVVY